MNAPAAANDFEGTTVSAAEPAAPSVTDPATEPEDFTTRTRILLGDEGIRRLSERMVAVCGVGGVGSNCVESLARAGVGKFLLIDRDVVEPSNINRQAVAWQSTVGQRKVDAMARLILDINPDAEVETRHMLLLPDTMGQAFDVRPDYIIDALDTTTTKLALAQYAAEQGIPFISSMGAGNRRDPLKLQFARIDKTSVCPLAKIIRKESRKRGIPPFMVLYSMEEPFTVPLPPDAPKNARPVLGTMPYMPAIMGQMIAAYVVNDLLGVDLCRR